MPRSTSPCTMRMMPSTTSTAAMSQRMRSMAGRTAGRGGRPGAQRRPPGRRSAARSPRGSTATPPRQAQPARPSPPARRPARRPPGPGRRAAASGSAQAARTRSTPAWRSALRSTRATSGLVEQERQHVVAVHPLGGGHVDLDAVAEVQQPLGAGPLPDQRVERRQQRPGPQPAPGQAGLGVQVGGLGPALDPHRAAAPPRRPARPAAGGPAGTLSR